MTRSLVPLMHRLAALGILFLLLLLAWFVLVAPVIGMIEERYAEIETLSDRLASLRATMRRIPELERREAALKAQLEDRGGVWTGPSDALIATAMQDRIREAASLGAGVIKSTAYLRGTDDKDFLTVRVRVTMDGTIDAVQSTLAAIETSRPAMFVDNLTVAAPTNSLPDKPPLLGLDLEVTGYMWKTPP